MKTAGERLRLERERQGLSLAEVSLSTKITTRLLKAIEEGNLNALPAPSFVRGFLRSYASLLKLDADEIVQQFNSEIAPAKAEPAVGLKTAPTPVQTPAEAQVVDSPKGSAQKIIEGSPTPRRVAMGLVFGVLVVAIYGVLQVVEKYEREGVVDRSEIEKSIPIGSVSPSETSQAQGAEAKQDVESVNADSLAETNKESSIATKDSAITSAKEASATASPSPASNPMPPPPSSAPATALSSAITPSTPPQPPVSVDSTATSTSKPTTALSEAAASALPLKRPGNPIEVTIEALDQVEVSLMPANGRPRKISLAPGEVHSVRSNGPFSLELSDGGVVNLIQNGKDRGVPGDLGQPKKVNFP